MRNFEMGGTSFTADSNDPMIGGTMASSMATGGGTKSAFDSTKARLKGKSQEYRINKLIEAVKETNWSSNPLTVNSGIVKVYSNMYDLEPTRVASIFNNYQKGSKMKKGGGLKGKAKYVPNYMVQSVEVERKGKTTDIDGANILDGVYVKKGVKFAKGGGFDGVDTELIDASAKTIYDKDGIMGLRNKFLVLANTDEKHGDKSTANYRRKVVADYQAKQPKFMAKGGKMEWGGTAESSETGAFIGGENTSSMYQEGGELNETFPDTDAMSYAKGGGVGNLIAKNIEVTDRFNGKTYKIDKLVAGRTDMPKNAEMYWDVHTIDKGSYNLYRTPAGIMYARPFKFENGGGIEMKETKETNWVYSIGGL